MQQRTSNIIMIIKGQHNYGDIEPIDAIKKYMAETCGCEESDYTLDIIYDVIQSTVLDYIKGSDRPEHFLFDYFEGLKYYRGDSIKAWISALCLVNVRKTNLETNSFDFVNGFNENNINVVDENTNELMFPQLSNLYKE